jgi:hypothetical protein
LIFLLCLQVISGIFILLLEMYKTQGAAHEIKGCLHGNEINAGLVGKTRCYGVLFPQRLSKGGRDIMVQDLG